jgi:ParB family chromosome partitioning protein
MTRKRRVFDVDLPPDPEADFPTGKGVLPAEYETKSAFPRRRGPMAAAIGETGDALRHRKQIEADIRAENDALAHEFVRLKRDGLIVDRVPIDMVNVGRLVRDRSTRGDLDLDDLKASLKAIGLSNPIRVGSRPDGCYDLIEGFRRLAAYRALLEETGDERWARIPAALLAGGEGEGALYRRMVDENLVRKDISFAEMAALAIAYADEHVDDCADVDEAVNRLYASASPQKRSYVRRFALLLRRMGKAIEHPEAIPRALGLKLADLIESDIDAMTGLAGALRAAPGRDAEAEGAILRAAVEGFTAGPKPRGAPKAARRGRVSLSVPFGPGARCTAADGKMEIRARMDFSTIRQDRLQAAIEAFFRELQE